MIEFTIKTLDSNNHHFSVEDDITVQALKEKVRDQIGLDINLQRLIFCGRVLLDEKLLSEYDVNGKVVHLVQRAPPCPESRNTSTNSGSGSSTPLPGLTAEPSPGTRHEIRRLMALNTPSEYDAEQEQALTLSPTTGRLEIIRRTIGEIKVALDCLRAQSDDEDSEENDSQDGTRRVRRRTIRALRTRHARPRDLANLMEELDRLHAEFNPYRTTYLDMLKAASEPEPPEYNEQERASSQRTVDLVTDLMHGFAHAYHAISDLSLQVGSSRLTADNALRPQVQPVAQINLQAGSRQQGATANSTATSGSGEGNGGPTPTTQSSTNAAPSAEANTDGQAAQASQPSAQAGRNTTQPTVNINIQPDLTYQVEIETSVPIAFPIENALFNGLTNMAPNNQQQPEQNQTQQGQPQNQGQLNQANRRQVFFDFEHLFRGLGNAGGISGVELIMSMEDLTRGGVPVSFGPNTAAAVAAAAAAVANASGNATNTSGNATNASRNATNASGNATNASDNANDASGNATNGPDNATGTDSNDSSDTQQAYTVRNSDGTETGVNLGPVTRVTEHPNLLPGIAPGLPTVEAGVYLAPVTWNGPLNADVLQNIVQSVVRQGLMAGGEGPASNASSQANPQSQTQSNEQNQTGQPTGQESNQSRLPPGTHIIGTPNLVLRQPGGLQFRRPNTTRAQVEAVTNMYYDRYLHCDNVFARRRVQRRRDLHFEHIASQEQLRAERAAARNIEMLRLRNTNLTEDNVQTMVQLLNGPPTEEAWMNAVMVAISRHLFLSELMYAVADESALMPNEFQAVRLLLRNYIETLLERSGSTDGQNAFEAVADFLVSEQTQFIEGMRNLTRLRADVDPYTSIRALVRSRLPAVIACVMSEANTETFALRFYSVFSRFFIDMCTLISYCCENGIDGLRIIYMSYLEQAVQNYDGSVQDLLLTLSTGNLNGILQNMDSHMEAIQPFIRRTGSLAFIKHARRFAERNFEPPLPVEIPLPPTSHSSGESAHSTPPSTSALNLTVSRRSDERPAGTTPQVGTAVSSARASTSSARTETATSNSSAPIYHQANNFSHTASNSSRTSRTQRSETVTTSTDGAPDSPTNMRFVPPVLIVQHWGEEWVPVFTRDQNRQRNDSQEAYSDAYLTGMPSRKRRCVRQSRPTNTLDGFMNESSNEANVEPPQTEDNNTIRHALREHMRNMARNRASGSDDYESSRFSTTARFVDSPVPNNQEQPDTENRENS
ncbi:large proline-rich protein bag6-A [Achroia grisella]|uniref:large proline-rich protein bag6-A n=1 Tax=Achroia grisella TaxID=688607 RepID=UPI0027D1FA1E|nr:large proline-rich protein bag6-A [Achroia grisella]